MSLSHEKDAWAQNCACSYRHSPENPSPSCSGSYETSCYGTKCWTGKQSVEHQQKMILRAHPMMTPEAKMAVARVLSSTTIKSAIVPARKQVRKEYQHAEPQNPPPIAAGAAPTQPVSARNPISMPMLVLSAHAILQTMKRALAPR